MISRNMKTALFPFTYLSHSAFMALKALFGAMTIYHPLPDTVPEAMRKWEADHQLHLCFPASGNESALHRALSDYRRWAESHAPAQRKFLRFQADQATQSNDTHTFRIRDEIRHRTRGKGSAPAADPLLTARLFLMLAQEYDIQQAEMTNDWAQLQKMENSLFDTLHGDLPPMAAEAGKMPVDIGAPESVLIAERLGAWSRLMLQDDVPPVMYVTTSREAFEIIADDTPSADLLPGFDAVSVPLPSIEASRQLMSYLDAVAASGGSLENSGKFNILEDHSAHRIRLTLAVVPDTPAYSIFSRYSGHASLFPENRPPYRHTLLALVEW